MKIISWNVNGIRSAYKKDFLKFITQEDPDIVCLQEIKAQENDLPFDLRLIPGYTLYVNSAEKKGYSGTAVYTKTKPLAVNTVLGFNRFDKEGRIIELSFENFTLINLYIPHGGRQKENLGYKLEVYKYLLAKFKKLQHNNVILMGDFNIAHKEIDLARPQQNKDNIMFTPKEREQLDVLVGLGFVDSFRAFDQKPGNYTWWPYAFGAKEKNMGWRIDYGFVSKPFVNNLKDAVIYSQVSGSDHCPAGLKLDI